MRKLLVLQHVRREPLGVLDPLLRASGLRIHYVNFARDPQARIDLERYDGLVVMGGPMNVDQQAQHPHLTYEIDLLQRAIAREMPTLGICLGSQLLAAALGAEVRRNPVPEIGWYPLNLHPSAGSDDLFQHMQMSTPVFQWHSYTFDIPQGAVHLASSPDCANQAFRYRDFAYGLQFHLEVDAPLIQRWLDQASINGELEPLGGPAYIHTVKEQTQLHVAQSQHQARRVFGAFLTRFGVREPRVKLRSR